jgi:D-tyrosyl-tRNA(Tyr) deacylase
VSAAHVAVDDNVVGKITTGLLVYLGAGKHDSETDPAWMAEKLATLRIFEDDVGKMSRSVKDIGGALLVVPQFTLYGDVRRGRRPSFDAAAEPAMAERAYLAVCTELTRQGLQVSTGQFRATMQVHAVVAGPVTILIDSERQF